MSSVAIDLSRQRQPATCVLLSLRHFSEEAMKSSKLSIWNSLRSSILLGALLAGLVLTILGCGNFFVGPKLTSVLISPISPSVTVGQTQQMSATGVYDDNSRSSITNEASWTSSNDAVATVSSAGLVKAISLGSTTISAYDLGYSASTTVTVVVADLVSISITPTSASIAAGQSQQFTAIGLLQTGNTVDLTTSVTWSSSNTAAATIDSYGLAVAASVSSATSTDITARSGSISSNIAVLTVR